MDKDTDKMKERFKTEKGKPEYMLDECINMLQKVSDELKAYAYVAETSDQQYLCSNIDYFIKSIEEQRGVQWKNKTT